MTTHYRRHLTRVLMVAAIAAGAWAATEMATDTAARADDKPRSVVEQPGGLLDHVTGVHDRIPGHRLDPQPDKPRKRDEARLDEDPRGDEDQAPTLPLLDQLDPEPKPEPEPPVAEPTPAPTEPATPTPPTAPIGDVVDVVEDVVDVVAPVLPALPALPASPAVPGLPVTLPATDPAPLPDADAPPAQPAPFPADAIGPVPAPPADPAPASPRAAVAALEVPPCSSGRPAPERGRGVVRPLTDQGSGLSATRPALPLRGGCPNVPDGDDNALNLIAMKPPSGFGVDLLAVDATDRLGHDDDGLLRALRPRTHLPAGSPTRIDPRPA